MTDGSHWSWSSDRGFSWCCDELGREILERHEPIDRNADSHCVAYFQEDGQIRSYEVIER